MLKGSCLCGGVKYEIDGALGAVTNCHCSLCRKMSGSAFSSGSTIPTASLRFVSGAELLKEWESSPGRDIIGYFAAGVAHPSSSVRTKISSIFVFVRELSTAIRG
jgi:hypothetical protein